MEWVHIEGNARFTYENFPMASQNYYAIVVYDHYLEPQQHHDNHHLKLRSPNK